MLGRLPSAVTAIDPDRMELGSGAMSITTNGAFLDLADTSATSSTWPRMKPSTKAFLIAHVFLSSGSGGWARTWPAG